MHKSEKKNSHKQHSLKPCLKEHRHEERGMAILFRITITGTNNPS